MLSRNIYIFDCISWGKIHFRSVLIYLFARFIDRFILLFLRWPKLTHSNPNPGYNSNEETWIFSKMILSLKNLLSKLPNNQQPRLLHWKNHFIYLKRVQLPKANRSLNSGFLLEILAHSISDWKIRPLNYTMMVEFNKIMDIKWIGMEAGKANVILLQILTNLDFK